MGAITSRKPSEHGASADGCSSFTSCPCGNHFCIVCGGAWPGCACPPLWMTRPARDLPGNLERIVEYPRPGIAALDLQDRRLQAVRHDPIADHHPAGIVAPRAPLAPIAANARPLAQGLEAYNPRRRQRECEHPKPWSRYHDGRHVCSTCHIEKKDPQVGWCRRCGLIECYRCRQNRPR